MHKEVHGERCKYCLSGTYSCHVKPNGLSRNQNMFQKSDARNWKNIYTVIKTDVIYFHKDKAAAGNETVK